MAEKKRGLGRGLSALLGDEKPPVVTGGPAGGGVRRIAVHHLHPGEYQPRRRMSDAEIDELAGSIRDKGVLSPLLVREHPGKTGEFEIIAGERRWRAAQRAQVHEVPVMVKALTNREALEVGLVENLQREDLTPLEEAEGYQRLMEEFRHTQELLSKTVGKSRSHVANMLRLLRLPAQVRTLLNEGAISAGHARALLSAPDAAAAAKTVVTKGLNVRQTEQLVQDLAAPKSSGGGRSAASVKKTGAAGDADTRNLEMDVADVLGLKVNITSDGGKGFVTIHFQTLDQLDDLLEKLSKP